jgi:hypothetical protein
VRREGVRVLGVDSVIEGNNDVVGSESGAPMGEGLGKGGTADLINLAEATGDEGAGEGLNTDAGRGVSLAIRRRHRWSTLCTLYVGRSACSGSPEDTKGIRGPCK